MKHPGKAARTCSTGRADLQASRFCWVGSAGRRCLCHLLAPERPRGADVGSMEVECPDGDQEDKAGQDRDVALDPLRDDLAQSDHLDQ